MDPDRSLASKLRDGEAGALEEAYRRHGTGVYRLCLRILGRAPDAEDATQEIFLKLLERASSFDGRSRLTTWIHRIAVNHCLNHLEKERLRDSASLARDEDLAGAPADSPFERLTRAEAGERLQRLLLRLSPEHRVAIVLREIEELSYEEIAQTLEVPVGTVMSRLARARERLVLLARVREPRTIEPAPAMP
jgi:RNA polymerase sigma-70 factor (ECF subfamily)